MRNWFPFLVLACLVGVSPAVGDVIWDEEADDIDISPIGPMKAGRLEINPIMSFRMSGGTMVYQVGAAVGYSITRHHQVGGSFVLGNRLYSRANRRQVTPTDDIRIGGSASRFSVDQGFGSSLTGFYRFNAPFEVSEKTYPHVEVFAGRDYGWGDLSEVGAGLGFRRFVSRTTAMTSQYSYVLLFAEDEHVTRHVISAGFTVFFN